MKRPEKNNDFKGKVSIIIPCFNQGDTLRQTLESIEKHRNTNLLEVIIVNDGSTDTNTLQLLSELEHSSYKVIHQSNKGLGSARNIGVKDSIGEFILPLDGDNLIRSPYLNEGVALLSANPTIGVVYGDAQYFGDRSGPWHVPNFDLAKLTLGNYIDACALIRRQALNDVGGYDENMPYMGWEDWDLWMRLGAKNWGFYHLQETAFDYRVRDGAMNCTSKKHGDELKEYIFHKSEYYFLSLLRKQQIILHSTRLELNRLKASRLHRVLRRLSNAFQI
jgi:glycosyltransferase involved in cell wall biosynthesis